MLESYFPSAIAGICGSLFVGYCVYFDRKRRSAPDFKKKLHERRNPPTVIKKKAVLKFPKLNDDEACEKFFMAELEKSDACFNSGRVSEGCDHVANALVVYDEEKKTRFLLYFQQIVTPELIATIVRKLPEAGMRLRNYQDNFQEGEEEEVEETESKIDTRFPCATDKQSCTTFVREEMESANKCLENNDFEGASVHFANLLVIIDKDEQFETMLALRQSLGDKMFGEILKETVFAKKRLEETVLRGDKKLTLSFLLIISALFVFGGLNKISEIKYP